MKMIKLALAALTCFGAGCTAVPVAPGLALSDLPNCFDSNYDSQGRLFTIKNIDAIWANPTKNPANQQCLLTVASSGGIASATRLTAGSYTIYLANGGGGGAGGTMQSPIHGVAGGGGGGGGAGANETKVNVYLSEGVYKLTIGAGGPGGQTCAPATNAAGGTGWAGSPSNVVQVATGAVVAGVPGADTYARPTLRQNEKLAVKGREGQGGSGPGQASGGAGARPESPNAYRAPAEAGANTRELPPPGAGIALGSAPGDSARSSSGNGTGAAKPDADAGVGAGTQGAREPPAVRGSIESSSEAVPRTPGAYTAKTDFAAGANRSAPGGEGEGGAPGYTWGADSHPSGGGGGGATDAGAGGSGGGDNLHHKDMPPVRGSLGSGGGGGQGSATDCDAGARGGHGYIAFRRN